VSKTDSGHTSPVPGVQVVYFANHIAIAIATTDSSGAYSFDAVPVGDFKVTAALNTRDRTEATGTLAAGQKLEKDLLIVVPEDAELGTVQGLVRLPNGTPAVGAIVNEGLAGAVTDSNGNFTLVGLPVQPFQNQFLQAHSSDGRRTGSTAVQINAPGDVVSGV